MRRFTFFVVFFLMLLVSLVGATEIVAPVDGWNYYNSINEANVTWDNASIATCFYSINSQANHTIPNCANSFIFDIPFNGGEVNFTIYENNGTNIISDMVTFQLIKLEVDGLGFIIAVIILLPLILSFGFWWLSKWLDKSHTPFKLFLLLLGFVFVLQSYNYASLAVREYLHFTYLDNVLSSGVFSYGMIFYVVITYFIIVFLIALFNKIKDSGE